MKPALTRGTFHLKEKFNIFRDTYSFSCPELDEKIGAIWPVRISLHCYSHFNSKVRSKTEIRYMTWPKVCGQPNLAPARDR